MFSISFITQYLNYLIMKKTFYLLFAVTFFFACNNEPNAGSEENTDQTDETTTDASTEMIEETIETSETINMSAEALWSNMSTLQGIENLIPEVISSSSVEGEGLGMKRTCTLADGSGDLQEEVTKLDPENMVVEVTVNSSPFPVSDYVNTMQIVKGEDENTCKMVWTSKYKCSKDVAPEVKESFTGVINLAYTNMNKMAMAIKE